MVGSNLRLMVSHVQHRSGRLLGRFYLIAVFLVVLFIAGLSMSTHTDRYLATANAYRPQIFPEFKMPDSVRLLRLPEAVKTCLLTNDWEICAAAQQEHNILPGAPRDRTLPPLEPGYGAMSIPDNLSRNRFLVGIYACDEQETGAQMHTRQILHLAKALGRTAVMPNYGTDKIPTMSNCRQFAFDDIYSLQEANDAEYWVTSYPTFERYISQTRNGHGNKKIPAQLSVVFSRDSFKQIWHLENTDPIILFDHCVNIEHFSLNKPTLYVGTSPYEDIDDVVTRLAPADDVEVLFVYFNHKSRFKTSNMIDPTLTMRPQWGLWARAPFPYWNYSTTVQEIYNYGRNRLPNDFVAVQWRLERAPPHILEDCMNRFIKEVTAGAKKMNIDTVYIASDAPLRQGAKFKSASWDLVFSQDAAQTILRFEEALIKAKLKVVTWDDIRPKSDKEVPMSALAEHASGVFDRLMVGLCARWLYAPNINCGMKSAYLASIQTARQDRIGDPTETDWNALGMTWIGDPLEGEFWWQILPAWENWDKKLLGQP